MPGKHHQRSISRPGQFAQDVAFGVSADVLQSDLPHAIRVFGGPHFLAERRRRDLAELNLLLDESVLAGLHRPQRFPDDRVGGRHRGRLGIRACGKGGGDQDDRNPQRASGLLAWHHAVQGIGAE